MRKLIPLILLLLVLAGCKQNDATMLQESTMDDYPSLTIGKAFNGTFTDAKWDAFKTDKGRRIVQFDGMVSQATHDSYRQSLMSEYDTPASRSVVAGVAQHLMGYKKFRSLIKSFSEQGYDNPERAAVVEALEGWNIWKVGTPVVFQWTIAADGESFELTYWDSIAWKGAKRMSLEDILAEVYN